MHLLKEINSLKATSKIPAKELLQCMIVGFSQQSCALEGNTIGIVESQEIWDKMSKNYNLDDLLKHEETQFPTPSSLSRKSEIEVIEIRNHLLVTYFLYNHLLKSEINIEDIKKVHRFMIKDTPQEKFDAWGKIQQAGEFRTISVRALGYHLTVYPVSFH